MTITFNGVVYLFHKIIQLLTAYTSLDEAEVLSPSSQVVYYHGAQVWRMSITNSSDLRFITSLADKDEISIWSAQVTHVDFLIKADKIYKTNKALKQRGKKYAILHYDVQKAIDRSMPKSVPWTPETLRVGHKLNWISYPTMDVIDGYFDFLRKGQNRYCSVINLGSTAENRQLQMVKISNGNPNNKVMFITGGMHGREWVSISSAFYVVDNICTHFENQPDHVKNMDWYIAPLMNPDGFVYSQHGDRLWRKNRSKIPHHQCIGVDINRNFEEGWGGMDSIDPCQETYGGMSAFSELETTALRNAYHKILPKKPAAYLDLHSYGQHILFPWAKEKARVPNYEQLYNVALTIEKVLYNTSSIRYKVGAVPDLLYEASGVALDWVYSLGTPLCVAMENRDAGFYGFVYPENLIIQAVNDALIVTRTLALCVEKKCENK